MTALEEAAAFKQTGNKAVASHEWLNAIEAYTKAIELNGEDATFFCNRAQVCFFRDATEKLTGTNMIQANIKLEQYGYAIADASRAIELDSDYVKVKLLPFRNL